MNSDPPTADRLRTTTDLRVLLIADWFVYYLAPIAISLNETTHVRCVLKDHGSELGLPGQAIREKEWKEIQQHLAPGFVGVTADGRKLDRLGWLEHWKTVEIRDLTIGEMVVQSSGSDMVVSYELKINGSESGRPIPAASLRVVSVWQELKKGWILTTQTSTPMMQGS